MAEPGATTSAIVLREHGGPDALQPDKIPLPPPAAGEIQLSHSAIGVNFHDTYVRSGLYRSLALPGVPGLEGAGTVVAVGAGAGDFRIGDRVAYVGSAYGGYAAARNLAADLAVRLPDGVDLHVAGAMFLKGLTAASLLHFAAPAGPGDTILVHAAAGGVGRLLVQWAARLGVRVIGTAGSAP